MSIIISAQPEQYQEMLSRFDLEGDGVLSDGEELLLRASQDPQARAFVERIDRGFGLSRAGEASEVRAVLITKRDATDAVANEVKARLESRQIFGIGLKLRCCYTIVC